MHVGAPAPPPCACMRGHTCDGLHMWRPVQTGAPPVMPPHPSASHLRPHSRAARRQILHAHARACRQGWTRPSCSGCPSWSRSTQGALEACSWWEEARNNLLTNNIRAPMNTADEGNGWERPAWLGTACMGTACICNMDHLRAVIRVGSRHIRTTAPAFTLLHSFNFAAATARKLRRDEVR
jgi:hypothetical protein